MKFKAAGIVTITREVRRHDAAGTYFDRTPLVAAAVFHEPPVFAAILAYSVVTALLPYIPVWFPRG